MMRFRPILIGMAVGLVAAVLTLCFWEAIPRETPARRIWDGVFLPEYLVVSRVTDWLSPHSRDQGILYWIIVHPLYCVSIGGVIGLAVGWVSRHRQRRGTT